MSRPTYSILKGMDAINNPCATDEDLSWRAAVNDFFGYTDADYEPAGPEGVFSAKLYQQRKAAEASLTS